MSGAIQLVTIATAFVSCGAFLVIVFVAILLEDRIVARVHDQHRDSWEAAGRPMGGMRAPEGAERSVASRQRGLRAMKAWAAATEGPLAGDAELVRLLRLRRTLIRCSYAAWAMAAAGIVAIAAASR